jgi:NADPH:quinone reductase-like Zn-dependent oxidoreductase
LTVGRAIAAGASIVNRKFWSVFGFPKYHLLTTSPNWTDLFDLRRLIDETHAIRPVVERVYPIEQTRAAFEEHMKRKTRGKIVIQVFNIHLYFKNIKILK